MKCIAHRGYSLQFRDNSIEAIREAVQRKYDGVEIDVQLCATGELVLHHDVYLDDHFVSDMSLEQLKEKSVCTLGDVYEQIPDIRQTLLLIDIKGSDISVVNALTEFYKTEPNGNVIFCSFNRKILYKLPKMFQRGSTFETTFHESEYERVTRDLQVVVLHWTCLDHELISYCNTRDIKVYTYTHKEDKELEYMYRYGVDGIITNGFTS
jgi:glycerophosphoryl diester phosphodiesterase